MKFTKLFKLLHIRNLIIAQVESFLWNLQDFTILNFRKKDLSLNMEDEFLRKKSVPQYTFQGNEERRYLSNWWKSWYSNSQQQSEALKKRKGISFPGTMDEVQFISSNKLDTWSIYKFNLNFCKGRLDTQMLEHQ